MPRLPLISCAGWENGVAVLTIGGIVLAPVALALYRAILRLVGKLLTQVVLT